MSIIRSQNGFGLIELSLAGILLAVILFALIIAQIESLRATYQSYLKTLVIIQIANMLENLRINHSSISQRRAFKKWKQMNQRLIPNSNSNYQCHHHICQVSIHWKTRIDHQVTQKAVVL